MEFIKVINGSLAATEYSPMNVVFTLIYNGKDYLLVKNKQSGYWELPAGEIQKSETHEECAIRRSKETSCQKIRNLKHFAICRIIFENRNSIEHFAIFSAEIEEEVTFEPTEETSDVLWFSPGMEISRLCTTCKNIIDYYEQEKNN